MFILHCVWLCAHFSTAQNSAVYKTEPVQKLKETRYDGPVAWCTVIQFKQWYSYQLVIFRDYKQGFLLKVNQKQRMVLRLCNMYRKKWIPRRFKIRSLPVANAISNDPVRQDLILTSICQHFSPSVSSSPGLSSPPGTLKTVVPSCSSDTWGSRCSRTSSH